MKFLIVLELLALYCHAVSGDYGTFTSYVNLEKLYTLEDELIGLTDVILNQERALHGTQDAHNICNITSVVQSVREIHDGIVNNRDLVTYLTNPAHVFKLTYRLTRDWQKIVERLSESQVCEKVMRRKIWNIQDNIPSEADLHEVVEALLRVQIIYNISADDLMTGNILGLQTGARLTGNEALSIARMAYTSQRYILASKWLQALIAKYDMDDQVDKASALNVLSSSYYKLGRKTDAVAALDELLKIDPNHVSAKRNKKFILESSKDNAEKLVTSAMTKTKQERRLVELCGDNFKPNITRQSRLFCTYLPERQRKVFVKPEVKTEVLSFKPLIILFHDIANASEQKAIKHLGYETMRDLLFTENYAYVNGIGSVSIKDYTRWLWASRIKSKLRNIAISEQHPSDTQLKVRNIGMEGYQTADKLTGFQKKFVLGDFLVFLSEVTKHGGDVVFPNAKVKVTPEKGSVLFYEIDAIEQMTVCPLVMDTQWVAMYPLFDNMQKKVTDVRKLFNLRKHQYRSLPI